MPTRTRRPSSKETWTTAYEKGLGSGKADADGSITVPAGNYGPLTTMMPALLSFAQSGGLDGVLLTSRQFYQTDYTKPLLLLADGSLLSDRAQAEHLLGEQWGMMNETGSYPGQVWLWLYTFWYQIKPFSTSANADILVMAVMGALSLALILVPFLPGVRDIPQVDPDLQADLARALHLRVARRPGLRLDAGGVDHERDRVVPAGRDRQLEDLGRGEVALERRVRVV